MDNKKNPLEVTNPIIYISESKVKAFQTFAQNKEFPKPGEISSISDEQLNHIKLVYPAYDNAAPLEVNLSKFYAEQPLLGFLHYFGVPRYSEVTQEWVIPTPQETHIKTGTQLSTEGGFKFYLPYRIHGGFTPYHVTPVRYEDSIFYKSLTERWQFEPTQGIVGTASGMALGSALGRYNSLATNIFMRKLFLAPQRISSHTSCGGAVDYINSSASGVWFDEETNMPISGLLSAFPGESFDKLNQRKANTRLGVNLPVDCKKDIAKLLAQENIFSEEKKLVQLLVERIKGLVDVDENFSKKKLQKREKKIHETINLVMSQAVSSYLATLDESVSVDEKQKHAAAAENIMRLAVVETMNTLHAQTKNNIENLLQESLEKDMGKAEAAKAREDIMRNYVVEPVVYPKHPINDLYQKWGLVPLDFQKIQQRTPIPAAGIINRPTMLLVDNYSNSEVDVKIEAGEPLASLRAEPRSHDGTCCDANTLNFFRSLGMDTLVIGLVRDGADPTSLNGRWPEYSRIHHLEGSTSVTPFPIVETYIMKSNLSSAYDKYDTPLWPNKNNLQLVKEPPTGLHPAMETAHKYYSGPKSGTNCAMNKFVNVVQKSLDESLLPILKGEKSLADNIAEENKENVAPTSTTNEPSDMDV